ncbi:MAG: hypothetical protein JSU79_01120 [Dehalococcoidales bacterium]|nr:MAG: hypothetical protein JSU79_01120 [Dehalococcoidales bacterium]
MKLKYIIFFQLCILIVSIFIVNSCVNVNRSEEQTSYPSTSENITDATLVTKSENLTGVTLIAKKDLAQRLGIIIENVKIRSTTEVEWEDTSLGCPEKDMNYAQVITPGYKIILTVNGHTYEYHTDTAQTVVLCSDIVKTTPPPSR